MELDSSKLRLAFIVDNFFQAGGQRYVYELARNIDKEIFEFDVITINSIQEDDYYYNLLFQLGIDIKIRAVYWLANISCLPNVVKKIVRKICNLTGFTKKRWVGYLSGYDLILFNQIHVYKQLQDVISREQKVVIHLMSHNIQYADSPYANLIKRDLNVVGICPLQEVEFRALNDSITNYVTIPLPFTFERGQIERSQGKKDEIVFAIFTRISPMKGLDVFLFALHLLKSRLGGSGHITLKIYGSIEDHAYKERLDNLINVLDLIDNVHFMGHVESIKAALQENCIDVVWMLSVNEFIGYASIEIAEFEFPIVFWNWCHGNYTGGDVRSFNSIDLFVDENIDLLKSEKLKIKYGINLSKHVRNKNISYSVVCNLSEFYLKILNM